MKHKNHDVIVAWAEGKPIQFGFINDPHQAWINFKVDDKSPNFDDASIKWRIKTSPLVLKYRVALMTSSPNYYYFAVHNEGNLVLENPLNSQFFLKWVTPMVEVEYE